MICKKTQDLNLQHLNIFAVTASQESLGGRPMPRPALIAPWIAASIMGLCYLLLMLLLVLLLSLVLSLIIVFIVLDFLLKCLYVAYGLCVYVWLSLCVCFMIRVVAIVFCLTPPSWACAEPPHRAEAGLLFSNFQLQLPTSSFNFQLPASTSNFQLPTSTSNFQLQLPTSNFNFQLRFPYEKSWIP